MERFTTRRYDNGANYQRGVSRLPDVGAARPLLHGDKHIST